ncbi:10371_t:CDS:2, partial [Gigaspora margarita]
MGITEHYTKLRLQVGMYKARIINDSWSLIELPKLNNIILDWERKENARALNLVFKELFDIRIANSLEKLNLFYLDQLTDSNDQCLLLWPEIKIRLGGKTRGKKPKWFSLLEEKIIENVEERTIKSEWISGQANQFGSSVSLLEISNDKRKKEWVLSEEVSEVAKSETRIEKCSGCKYNRSIVEENCTTRIKFDGGWK